MRSAASLVGAVVLALAAGGCLVEGGEALCDDDIDNDADGRVDCADPSCDLAETCGPCGDGKLDESEACDDGNNKDDDGCSSRCALEGCGNGTTDPGEACDDGNLAPGDGCNFRCQPDRCGDGSVNAAGEECDDGNLTSRDGCSRYCRAEPDITCGNLRFDPGEQCEDGNRRDGDGCSANCQGEFCGDGVVQPLLGEQCEGTETPDGTPCQFCRVFLCGNGALDGVEQCDDGNTFDGDGCTSFCTVERCGDFIQQQNESCDDGNSVSGDGCSATCRVERCGDGIVQPRLGELCDQGPDCTAQCRLISACAALPSGAERCFDVDVRNASLVARSITAVRTPEGTWVEIASVQAGFVERHQGTPGGGMLQPSYPRSPIIVAALDLDGDGLSETAASNFDGTASLHGLAGGGGITELSAVSLDENGLFIFPTDLRTAPLFAADEPLALSLAQGGRLVVFDAALPRTTLRASLPSGAVRVAGARVQDGEGLVFVAADTQVLVLRALRADGGSLTLEEPFDAGATVGDLAVGAVTLATHDGPALFVLTKAPDTLLVLPIETSGVLGAPITLTQTPGADAMTLGDMDGDALIDVVTANAGHTLSLYLAAEDYAPSTTLAAPSTPARPVIADLDGDGDMDLATGGGFFQPQVVLYRAQ